MRSILHLVISPRMMQVQSLVEKEWGRYEMYKLDGIEI